jgi:apolipoprotein N-acyltransferase
MRLNGAECFFNLSNDAWSKSLACQNQHLAMAVFRCVENKIPAVRSTSSGQTCIINQNGIIQEMCEPFCSSYVVANVPILNSDQDKMTFYTKTGDLIGFVFFIFSLIMLLTKIFIGIIKTWQKKRISKKEI